MNSYSWRERQEHGGSSSSAKGKVLKSKLYFLGDPKKLQNNDVYRHVCKGCNRVFHKSLGLEWHVMDEHPHLYDEVKRDLEVIAANKRIIPERRAAYMGEKRRKSGVDLLDVKHDEENNTYYSDADISQLLESSEEEDYVNDKNDTQECKDRLKQQVIKKECEVKIPKLILKERKCSVKLQKLILTGADDDHENEESHENYSSHDDDSIIIETASDSSVPELAPSSHQVFNQPDTDSPQERECYVKLQKLCLAGANDDCENVVIDESYTGDDESIVVETASDSSVIELYPSSHQLSNQPDTIAAHEIDSGAESRDLSSLAPVMVDEDKVQWWLKKFV